MNANIFSCTVPPLLVLETQVIHPEPLQSLCINQCVPLVAIFLQTYARGQMRLRPRADVYALTYPFAPALTYLHAPSTSVDLGLTRRLH